MTQQSQNWRARSLCVQETPDAPELWTSDRRPKRALLVLLQRVCDSCPVQTECATDAVTSGGQTGMYAGRHLPEKRENNPLWASAMDELRQIAGLATAVDDAALMAVPA